uniref:uncharacterized protein LOC117603957 n=1 Tax=Osmia lignaria TaxID=473952 RepID=UPI00147966F6|nr:uncharacterized protein LOC117603957 [Osmia lignaria]
MYISQNGIGSKVHRPNSPSTSKEVRAGIHTYRTMQSMIPFFTVLSLVSASRLTLLPYAYLSSPFPVSHHFQDTRTGVHAYSYAGGPSAKEEIKDADGVLRGSYSYIDANGILQSVFYVADDDGFRVAATNLPTDENVEAEQSHILLARSADSEKSSRRRRSIEESPQNPGQKGIKDNVDQGTISNSAQKATTASSYQQNGSQGESDEKQPIVTRSVIQPVILSGDIPLATSHQSQVQVHNNQRIDLTQDKPVERQLILSAPAILQSLPVLTRVPSYHENRIELHKQLGIEGSKPKDAVKIDPEPITVVPSSSIGVPLTSTVIAKESVPVLPVISNDPLAVIPTGQLASSSVTTSISSHGVSQIHGPSRETISIPNLIAKPSIPVATLSKAVPISGPIIGKEVLPVVPIAKEGNLATATVTTSISSHGVSQIHGNSKIEPTLLVKTTPIAQIHSLLDVPIYLHDPFGSVILIGIFLEHSLATPIANVWLSPIGSLTPLRQFHIQDGAGGYHYSFTGPHHAKSESSLNGITQGGYSYVDANGVLQTVTYTADDENGFRVSASNLPQPPKNHLQTVQDTPEVAAAKKNHLEELQKSQLRDQSNYQSNILSYKILPSYFSVAQLENDNEKNLAVREISSTTKNPFLLPASEAQRIKVPKPDNSLLKSSPKNPSSIQSAHQRKNEIVQENTLQSGKLVTLNSVQRPVAVPGSYVLPVLPYRLLHSALHHTQDSLGQYDYTYAGDSSAKTESRSLDGTTRGAYSYIDPNGILQQVHYVADHNGFRVLATNLPEAK